MAGFQLTAGQMKAIREVVQHYRNLIMGEVRAMMRVQQQAEYYVVLDGTLSPATAGAALTTPSTATASVYYCDSAGDLVDSGRNITVTNYFEHIEVLSGTLAIATWTAGHWRLTSADCEPLT